MRVYGMLHAMDGQEPMDGPGADKKHFEMYTEAARALFNSGKITNIGRGGVKACEYMIDEALFDAFAFLLDAAKRHCDDRYGRTRHYEIYHALQRTRVGLPLFLKKAGEQRAAERHVI
jgi:hypothetical protein